MRIKRSVIKRSCDEWDDEDVYWFDMGSAESLTYEKPRFKSVSPSAHTAMMTTKRPTIGFHRPGES